MAAQKVFKPVLVETDHATFVHITQPIAQTDEGQRQVDGLVLECFEKGQGVLVSNSRTSSADTKIKQFLDKTSLEATKFLALSPEEQAKQVKQNGQARPLSAQAASCLLIPAISETFDKEKRIIDFVKEQHKISEDQVVRRNNDQLDNLDVYTVSKQYVSLKLFSRNISSVSLRSLYQYFVDVFYALYRLHTHGFVHGWIRSHSVCVSKLNPTTSSSNVLGGLARFDYAYDKAIGPINAEGVMDGSAFVSPAINALYETATDSLKKKQVLKDYGEQLDLYALFVVLYDLLHSKSGGNFENDDFTSWVHACTLSKESIPTTSLTGVHKLLEGVTFREARHCCSALVQAFGIETNLTVAKLWMSGRYKLSPSKPVQTPRTNWGRGIRELKQRPEDQGLPGNGIGSVGGASSASKRSKDATEVEDPRSEDAVKDAVKDAGEVQGPPSDRDAEDHFQVDDHHDDGVGDEPSAAPTVLVDYTYPVPEGSEESGHRVACLKWESKVTLPILLPIQLPIQSSNDKPVLKDGEHYVQDELSSGQLKKLVATQDNLKRFRKNAYIDDHTMNLFNSLIPLESHVFVTMCASREKITQRERFCPTLKHTVVYIPIGYNNSHWFFIRVDRRNQGKSPVITLFDSLLGYIDKSQYPGLIERAMVQFGLAQESYAYSFAKTPQQDGADCGFYTCLRIWYDCTNQDVKKKNFKKFGWYKEPVRLFMARCILENCIPAVVRDNTVDVFPNQYLVSTDHATWDSWQKMRRKLNEERPPFLGHITQPPSWALTLSAEQADELGLSRDYYFGVSRSLLALNNSTYLLLGTRSEVEAVTNKGQARKLGHQTTIDTITTTLSKMKEANYGFDNLKSLLAMIGVVGVYATKIQLPFVLRKYESKEEAQASYDASIEALKDLPGVEDEDDDNNLLIWPNAQDNNGQQAPTFEGDCLSLRPKVKSALEAQLDSYTAHVVQDLLNANEGAGAAWPIVNTALLSAVQHVEFKGFAKHITRADGNCFYQCVCKALRRSVDVKGITELRKDILDYYVKNAEAFLKEDPWVGEGISDHHVKQYLRSKNLGNTDQECTDLINKAKEDKDHEYFKWYFTTNGIYADQFGIVMAAKYAGLNYIEAKFVVNQEACENVLQGQTQNVTVDVNVSCDEKIAEGAKFMVLLFSGLSNNGHFDLLMPESAAQKEVEVIDMNSPKRRRRTTEPKRSLKPREKLEDWLTQQKYQIVSRRPNFITDLKKLVLQLKLNAGSVDSKILHGVSMVASDNKVSFDERARTKLLEDWTKLVETPKDSLNTILQPSFLLLVVASLLGVDVVLFNSGKYVRLGVDVPIEIKGQPLIINHRGDRFEVVGYEKVVHSVNQDDDQDDAKQVVKSKQSKSRPFANRKLLLQQVTKWLAEPQPNAGFKLLPEEEVVLALKREADALKLDENAVEERKQTFQPERFEKINNDWKSLFGVEEDEEDEDPPFKFSLVHTAFQLGMNIVWFLNGKLQLESPNSKGAPLIIVTQKTEEDGIRTYLLVVDSQHEAQTQSKAKTVEDLTKQSKDEQFKTSSNSREDQEALLNRVLEWLATPPPRPDAGFTLQSQYRIVPALKQRAKDLSLGDDALENQNKRFLPRGGIKDFDEMDVEWKALVSNSFGLKQPTLGHKLFNAARYAGVDLIWIKDDDVMFKSSKTNSLPLIIMSRTEDQKLVTHNLVVVDPKKVAQHYRAQTHPTTNNRTKQDQAGQAKTKQVQAKQVKFSDHASMTVSFEGVRIVKHGEVVL